MNRRVVHALRVRHSWLLENPSSSPNSSISLTTTSISQHRTTRHSRQRPTTTAASTLHQPLPLLTDHPDQYLSSRISRTLNKPSTSTDFLSLSKRCLTIRRSITNLLHRDPPVFRHEDEVYFQDHGPLCPNHLASGIISLIPCRDTAVANT